MLEGGWVAAARVVARDGMDVSTYSFLNILAVVNQYFSRGMQMDTAGW